jgi:hypothetical protein
MIDQSLGGLGNVGGGRLRLVSGRQQAIGDRQSAYGHRVHFCLGYGASITGQIAQQGVHGQAGQKQAWVYGLAHS